VLHGKDTIDASPSIWGVLVNDVLERGRISKFNQRFVVSSSSVRSQRHGSLSHSSRGHLRHGASSLDRPLDLPLWADLPSAAIPCAPSRAAYGREVSPHNQLT
jgi:hypothetical protein